MKAVVWRQNHGPFLLGPPGAGTSMLARRLTTVLPDLTLAEAIDTTRIPRIAGLTGRRTAVVTTRPCRAPHHTIADVGLIGGGQVPMPGEVSLAHHGVLFLDEGRSSNATSWQSCASPSRMASHTDNLPHVLDLFALTALAARMQPCQPSLAWERIPGRFSGLKETGHAEPWPPHGTGLTPRLLLLMQIVVDTTAQS